MLYCRRVAFKIIGVTKVLEVQGCKSVELSARLLQKYWFYIGFGGVELQKSCTVVAGWRWPRWAEVQVAGWGGVDWSLVGWEWDGSSPLDKRKGQRSTQTGGKKGLTKSRQSEVCA